MDPHSLARDLATDITANCIGMRVTRLHRVVTRTYEQALRPLGISLPQVEILTAMVNADRPVKPAALAVSLLLERSTLSRNLALLQQRGWVDAAETSPTGRTMAVAMTEAGVAALAGAKDAWHEAQAALTAALGDDAPATLDRWITLLTD